MIPRHTDLVRYERPGSHRAIRVSKKKTHSSVQITISSQIASNIHIFAFANAQDMYELH